MLSCALQSRSSSHEPVTSAPAQRLFGIALSLTVIRALRSLPLLAVALVMMLVMGLMAGSRPALAREMPADTAVIDLADLPPEARRTLDLIRRGGPFPYAKDGTVFANRERQLPRQPRGYYTEYTVKTPGTRSRGARRIIAGGDPPDRLAFWYTDDHYRTFSRIREPSNDK